MTFIMRRINIKLPSSFWLNFNFMSVLLNSLRIFTTKNLQECENCLSSTGRRLAQSYSSPMLIKILSRLVYHALGACLNLYKDFQDL